jgi:hypothetical protein
MLNKDTSWLALISGKPSIWAIALVLLAGSGSVLRAQDSAVLRGQPPPAQSTASADEQILAGLEKAKKDGEGLVIIAGGFEGLSCNGIEVMVGRSVDGTIQQVRIPAVNKFFGSYRNIRPKGLGAGEWMLATVKCIIGSSGGHLFTGPYAKFTVPAGGIVDAGFLKIGYQRDDNLLKTMFTGAATIRLSVIPTPEFRLAELRKQIPRVMALVKKQPMVLTVPAEQKVKFKNSLF